MTTKPIRIESGILDDLERIKETTGRADLTEAELINDILRQAARYAQMYLNDWNDDMRQAAHDNRPLLDFMYRHFNYGRIYTGFVTDIIETPGAVEHLRSFFYGQDKKDAEKRFLEKYGGFDYDIEAIFDALEHDQSII